MKIYNNLFIKVISKENLFKSWIEFKKGKLNKEDVLAFRSNLKQNIESLHQDLLNHTYKHGKYTSFRVSDPKPRIINKANIRDRVLHHAICRIIIPIFEPTFISNSFSCRKNKGTHKGVQSLRRMINKVSKNNHKPCFILKCDIKKFFESIDHEILLTILFKRIKDQETQELLKEVVESFNPGIPLGNVVSQWFSNIYLNELDQYLKHKLKIKNYIRYTDDFLIVSQDKKHLMKLIPLIWDFLKTNLKLQLHPNKLSIKKIVQGIDFLGYITFPNYKLIRTRTKRRILKKINEKNKTSYFGVLSHANAYKLKQILENKLKTIN